MPSQVNSNELRRRKSYGQVIPNTTKQQREIGSGRQGEVSEGKARRESERKGRE